MNKELLINTYEGETLLFKENLLGTFENNILKYENETDSFLIDIEHKLFQKENLESILNISHKKALLTVKELEQSFDIELNMHNFMTKENKIILEYLLETNENPIKIEIEMSDINEPQN